MTLDRAMLISAGRRISAAYAKLWQALELDKLDAVFAVGLGCVCYGVAHLYSPSHAWIVGGSGVLAFALIGLVWRLLAQRQG